MAFIGKYKKYLITSASIWAVCLVLFVLAYLIMLRPQIRNRKQLESRVTEQGQMYEFAQKAAQEETKARLNEEIELLQNRLDSFVIDFKGAEDLTFDISQIAGENNVSSFNVESRDIRAASASADPNNLFEKHIKVSFTAGFREFAAFLNALERHQPVLFVNEFTLLSLNNDKTAYQVTLDVAAFVRKQQVAKVADTSSARTDGVKL